MSLFTDPEKQYMIDNSEIGRSRSRAFLHKNEKLQVSYSEIHEHIEVNYFFSSSSSFTVFDDVPESS